jgi:hypothetical protein
MRVCERTCVVTCECMFVYIQICLKIALLDQHSHRFHVSVLNRVNEYCATVLPSLYSGQERQQRSIRGVYERVPMPYV